MKLFSVSMQPAAFLLLAAAGFGAGLLFDLTGLLRRRLPAWARPPVDMLTCLAAAAACALALAVTGEHRLRLYALLGLCCGGGVYALGLRTLALAILRRFKRRSKPSETYGEEKRTCKEKKPSRS